MQEGKRSVGRPRTKPLGDVRDIHLMLDAALADAIIAKARQNDRTITAEITRALKQKYQV